MLEAWLNTGRAAPVVMASVVWVEDGKVSTGVINRDNTVNLGDAIVVLKILTDQTTDIGTIQKEAALEEETITLSDALSILDKVLENP